MKAGVLMARCGRRRPCNCPDCIHAWEDEQRDAAGHALYIWAAQNTDLMIGGLWEAENEEFKEQWRKDADLILGARELVLL